MAADILDPSLTLECPPWLPWSLFTGAVLIVRAIFGSCPWKRGTAKTHQNTNPRPWLSSPLWLLVPRHKWMDINTLDFCIQICKILPCLLLFGFPDLLYPVCISWLWVLFSLPIWICISGLLGRHSWFYNITIRNGTAFWFWNFTRICFFGIYFIRINLVALFWTS